MYADPLSRLEKHIERVPISGCWLWTGYVHPTTGYGQTSINSKTVTAHRTMYTLTHGDPGQAFVCHACDVRCCVNPAHMFLGSPADNQNDMVSKGRSAHSEKNGRAKLTVDQVLAIRASAESQRALARQYGVGQSQIWRIRNDAAWYRS